MNLATSTLGDSSIYFNFEYFSRFSCFASFACFITLSFVLYSESAKFREVKL